MRGQKIVRILRRRLGADRNYRLDGKTVAVSGATGGIGRALCRQLCELGASLVLLDRSRERSLAFIKELKADFPTLRAEHITLDLEDISRVSEVCDILSDNPPDYLVLNAGAYSIPRHKCTNGFDNVFVINFLSPYCLARSVLDAGEKTGVVAVGSIAHRYSASDEVDVDFLSRKRASLVYGNAKRYLMYSLDGLEDGRRKRTVIVHPGIAVTNITAHYPKAIYALIKYPMKLIFMSPRRASLSVLCGLFVQGAAGEWIGPRVFDVWGLPKRSDFKPVSAERERITRFAEELYEDTKK